MFDMQLKWPSSSISRVSIAVATGFISGVAGELWHSKQTLLNEVDKQHKVSTSLLLITMMPTIDEELKH